MGTKKGFLEKTAKAAANTKGEKVVRRRRGGAGKGKVLTKPILGAVHLMRTKGGGVTITVTPFGI